MRGEVALLVELALLEATPAALRAMPRNSSAALPRRVSFGTDGLIFLIRSLGRSSWQWSERAAAWFMVFNDGFGVDQPLAALTYAYMHHDLVHAGNEIGVHLTAPA